MQKLLIFIYCFIFVSFSILSFAGWTNIEDYKAYKKAKELASNAEGSGDTFNAIANYRKAAELAAKSGTVDIQAWQLNNAAFGLIKQFKKLTGYEEKLQKLSEMKPGKEKLDYQTEIAEFFNLQANLLEEAKTLLNESNDLLLEETVESKTNTKEAKVNVSPKEKIASNIQFIEWVENFIKDNLKQEETQIKTEIKKEKKNK